MVALDEARKILTVIRGMPIGRLEITDSVIARMRQINNLLRGQPPALYARADEEYQAYTSQVSLITRTMALTAIVVIWLFARGKQGSTLSPFNALRTLESERLLLFSLGFALGALVADLLQYVWGSIAWGAYRWSLDQVLVNDSFAPSDLSMRVRLGWMIARLFGIAKRFEFGLNVAVSESAWRVRREHLRKRLKALRDGGDQTDLQAVLNSSWAPLAINRLISLFYGFKVLALLVSYILLAIYLFS